MPRIELVALQQDDVVVDGDRPRRTAELDPLDPEAPVGEGGERVGRALLRVWRREQLLWALPEVDDAGLVRLPGDRVLFAVLRTQSVRQRVEDVLCVDRPLPSALVPEYQIDPAVYRAGDLVEY